MSQEGIATSATRSGATPAAGFQVRTCSTGSTCSTAPASPARSGNATVEFTLSLDTANTRIPVATGSLDGSDGVRLRFELAEPNGSRRRHPTCGRVTGDGEPTHPVWTGMIVAWTT